MKKFFLCLFGAVIFGGVAGATFYGISNINYVFPGVNVAQTGGEDLNEIDNKIQVPEQPKPEISKSSEKQEAPAQTETKTVTTAVLDVSDIVEDAMPQVVGITNTMVIEQRGYSSLFDYFYGNGFTQEYEVPASGSGIILSRTDDELLIVTNNHVIEDARKLTVTFVDGTNIEANVKGYDSSLDIAVLAVSLSDIPEETLDLVKVATYHDNNDLKVGQGVIAIGNALGYGQTVTVGYISALGRDMSKELSDNDSDYTDLIQVDAAINPGNSGGALLNMDGEVIGINVAKLASSAVEAIGYAIPIYKVMDVVENLSTEKTKIQVEEEKRGRLGVYINTVSSSAASALGIPAGAIIISFSDEYNDTYGLENVMESPARKAGLLENDIIIKVDSQSVSTAEELSQLISCYEEGDAVTIGYMRLENGAYNEGAAVVILGGVNDQVIDPVNADEVPEEEIRETTTSDDDSLTEEEEEEEKETKNKVIKRVEEIQETETAQDDTTDDEDKTDEKNKTVTKNEKVKETEADEEAEEIEETETTEENKKEEAAETEEDTAEEDTVDIFERNDSMYEIFQEFLKQYK